MTDLLYDDVLPADVAAKMREKAKQWRMLEMCENCPFRDDGGAIELADGRLEEIQGSVSSGADFYCHKSLDRSGDLDEDEDDHFMARPGDLLCAGACAYQDEEGSGASQFRRIAERLDYGAIEREVVK